MGVFVVRRLGWAVIALLGIAVINFAVIHALPVNFAKVIAGTHASAVTLAEITHNYGLNQPVWVQFGIYLGQLLRGNLGYSYVSHLPVTSLLAQAIPKTVYLALVAVFFEVVIGVPLGIWLARHANSWLDSALTTVLVLGISIPTFALGSGLLYLFAFKMGLFPVHGYAPFPHIKYVILPALSYALTGAAYYARLLRTSLLEVVSQDFIRTARAKGASERRVIWKHMLRNALLPLLTYFGLDLGGLLGGLVVTETIFGWPGIGDMTYRAIAVIDVPTIMGVVLFASFAIVLMNLIIDVLYVFVDPRISYT